MFSPSKCLFKTYYTVLDRSRYLCEKKIYLYGQEKNIEVKKIDMLSIIESFLDTKYRSVPVQLHNRYVSQLEQRAFLLRCKGRIRNTDKNMLALSFCGIWRQFFLER